MSRDYRRLTQQELVDEARARFGDDPQDYAFECPNCGDIATIREFAELVEEDLAGQECIGRALGDPGRPTGERGQYADRGCNWVAYGLIRGPWIVVMPAEGNLREREVGSFALATPATRYELDAAVLDEVLVDVAATTRGSDVAE